MMKNVDREPWDDARILLAVLRAGTFRGAARALKLEQSTVSRRIAALEATLGGELFDRRPSGPIPTALALRLRRHAERMSGQWLALREQANVGPRVPSGRVRLTVPSSFAVHVILPFVVPRLKAKYPRLALDLVVDERTANLGAREAEIAVRFFKPKEPSLVAQRVARLPTAVLASRAYAASSLGTAKALDWVVLELPGGDTLFAELIDTEPALRTTMHLAQIEAVRCGLGVAILPRPLIHIMPELVEVKVNDLPLPHTELWLTAPQSLARTPRIRAVWMVLMEVLGELEKDHLLLAR